MKCGTCGAINGSSAQKCEFCQTALLGATQATAGAMPASPASTQVAFAKDALGLVRELNTTPSKGFNLWAFFFPIGYLTGYHADSSAKKVATVILLPTLVVSLLMYVFEEGIIGVLLVLYSIWVLWVAFLVATRTPALVRPDIPFELGRGIGFAILFGLLYYLILLI